MARASYASMFSLRWGRPIFESPVTLAISVHLLCQNAASRGGARPDQAAQGDLPPALQPQPQAPAPPGHEGDVEAAPPVGRPLGQCLPRPAVIAHRQLEAALRLGLEPEGQPGKILFFRAVQPDVPADQLEPHPLFEAVGPLPVLLPLRIRRQTALPSQR